MDSLVSLPNSDADSVTVFKVVNVFLQNSGMVGLYRLHQQKQGTFASIPMERRTSGVQGSERWWRMPFAFFRSDSKTVKFVTSSGIVQAAGPGALNAKAKNAAKPRKTNATR
jgi:hypothetical protein